MRAVRGQIGSVTESIAAHQLAKSDGWGTMVSHRSGETEDPFIADLVVGLSTGQVSDRRPPPPGPAGGPADFWLAVKSHCYFFIEKYPAV